MALGVGARKALAASAAINWMLKDGMNRLVRMGVATQFGDSFDSDLKVRGGGAGLTPLEGVYTPAFCYFDRLLARCGPALAHALAREYTVTHKQSRQP